MMKTSRRGFLKALGQVVLGSAAAGAVGYGYSTEIEPDWLSVEQLEIPLKKLRPALEGFKIVHMSDIHLHPYTQLEFVQKAVAKANTLQPDLVVLTGDYVLESADSIFELAPALAGLNPKYGIFTSLGNHDLWTNAEVVLAGLRQAGLPVLVNDGVALGVGSDLLYLAGLDDGWSGQLDLTAALAKLPQDAPVILLAHEPDLADNFALDGRISLQLSGHSHGGQVRLPGIGAPILPYLGRKYDQGLYRVREMWVYTTRGIGLGPVPTRFNCPPEITEITLVGA
ncbi:MAG: metallophosphoesterase [Anaerolineales bacterium]|nr:metallophosphoesterase [Anaerolineales bacterium]